MNSSLVVGVSRETPAISVSDLSARQGQRTVLHDITFDLPAGTLAILVGPNGSGKSTLLYCLTGGLRPTNGEVYIGGQAVTTGRALALSRRMAYVPQSSPMTFPFTVEELVRLGATDNAAVEDALSAVELTALRGRSVLSLSGGERQRAALARALAQRTSVLLLDEPITHLDPRHQIGVLQAARDAVRAGRTVLAVLHELTLAATFADRILLLHEGVLVAFGPPAETLTAERLQQVYGIPFATASSEGIPAPLVALPALMASRPPAL